MLETKTQSNTLTGQYLFRTTISPLGSISPLDDRHSITIDRAGNHELA